jgi:hypothetical protein
MRARTKQRTRRTDEIMNVRSASVKYVRQIMRITTSTITHLIRRACGSIRVPPLTPLEQARADEAHATLAMSLRTASQGDAAQPGPGRRTLPGLGLRMSLSLVANVDPGGNQLVLVVVPAQANDITALLHLVE